MTSRATGARPGVALYPPGARTQKAVLCLTPHPVPRSSISRTPQSLPPPGGQFVAGDAAAGRVEKGEDAVAFELRPALPQQAYPGGVHLDAAVALAGDLVEGGQAGPQLRLRPPEAE